MFVYLDSWVSRVVLKKQLSASTDPFSALLFHAAYCIKLTCVLYWNVNLGRSDDTDQIKELLMICPQIFFSSLLTSDRPWGPSSSFQNKHRVPFTRIKLPKQGTDHSPLFHVKNFHVTYTPKLYLVTREVAHFIQLRTTIIEYFVSHCHGDVQCDRCLRVIGYSIICGYDQPVGSWLPSSRVNEWPLTWPGFVPSGNAAN